MNEPKPTPKHILFLFSDTGGGHRSAAEAITEALALEYGEQVTTELLDFIKEYAPHPLNQMPAWYPYMVRVPDLWGVNYQLSDGWRRTRAVLNVAYPYTYRALNRMKQEHTADLIVSVHPLATSQILRALGKPRPLFATVVTDLVTTHAFWYEPEVDLCIVPTEGAKRRALKYRVPESKIRVVGLPVADRFCQSVQDKQALRQEGFQTASLDVSVADRRSGRDAAFGPPEAGPVRRVSEQFDRAVPVVLDLGSGLVNVYA